MGSLFGGMMGGGGKAQKVDWKQLERMMDYSARMNRFNDQGIFGGTEWTENPDGTWERKHVVNEALQPGIEALMNRAVSPIENTPYGAPSQFGSLMDAKMANQMGRHGILGDQQQPNLQQGNFGPRYGDQGMNLKPQPGQGGPPPQAAQQPNQAQAQQAMMQQAQAQQAQQQGPPQQMTQDRWDQISKMIR